MHVSQHFVCSDAIGHHHSSQLHMHVYCQLS